MTECRMYINGKWLDSDTSFYSINPATEKIIGKIYLSSEENVRMAVESAKKAQSKWSALSLNRRAEYLKKMGKIILQNSESLKVLITREMGKPIRESEIEVLETADIINFFSEEGKAYMNGETYSVDNSIFPDRINLSIREPVGVVGIIKPWNYPLELPMWSILPALLTGNTVVFKPSEYTPMVATVIGKIAEEAGLPQGVLNIVNGNGRTGEALTLSDVDMISFTGSVETGKKIMMNSSKKLHKLTVELGGSDPFIILSSANLEEAVNGALWGRFNNCGQVCVSAKRIIVLREIYRDFLDLFVEKVSDLNIGDGLLPDTDIGPLVSETHRQKILEQLSDAKKKGATVETGGNIPKGFDKGFFFEPTILVDVRRDMRVWKEEVFGPIASIMVADDPKEAVNIANDSIFGLGASVWGQNMSDVFYITSNLKCGMVWVNEINTLQPNCPWGGIKNSGFGKELGKDGIYEYTHLKNISIYHGGKTTRDWWFPYGRKGQK